MANPATTHVIEIEAGIGEPAFIPLSMGQELQPISVGKKGMWRIESPRVLDVHAFVYFDGTSLFLQSADDANAASVDGYRVGKAWTELSAPCKIEIGQARLQFRSLIADDDNQATQIAMSPPVALPPGGPGSPLGSGPGASMPVAVAAPPPPPGGPGLQRLGTRPLQSSDSSNPPIAFPKNDRPFKPGEFAAPPDDESTRIAPLESTGAGRIVSGAHARPEGGAFVNSGPMIVQGPMMAPVQALGFPQSPMMGPPGFDAQGGPPTPMQAPGMMMQGQAPMAPGSYPGQPVQAYPNPGASGAYGIPPNQMMPNGMGPNGMNGMPMNNGMGGQQPYMQMGPHDMQQGMPAQTDAPPQKSKLEQALGGNSLIKIVAGVLIILAGVLFLLQDDPQEDARPKKKKPVASADAGAAAVPTTPPVAIGSAFGGQPVVPADAGAAVAATGGSAWPEGVPCPPPNWPPNVPLPCTPRGAGGTPTIADAGTTATGTSTKTDKTDKPDRPDRSSGKAPSTPTLERQAIDLVAAGETAKAAAAYEDLVRREPNNKVYAEAARILRAKLDAGAPAP